jgi:uncharacterized protein (DUF2235 family)
MPKHIVLCSDGTGNTPAKGRGTNVWKIYMAIDRHDHEEQRELLPQVAFYDDGVGSGGIRAVRVLGGAFGLGLSRNIRELYASLVLHWEPGDKVFLFGFSRGAFTIRSVAGMICRCGLLRREEYLGRSASERTRILKRILRAYRSENARVAPDIRKELGLRQIGIEFIGVWDTVDAVGLPFDELKWIDPLWRAVFGVRLWGFHDRALSSKVKRGCQALAIDDERRTFHPNVWAPRKEGGIEQVWFAGVHSNIGGGYPKEELSNVSLYWMMRQAQASRLRFVPDAVAEAHQQGNGHGKLYGSRAGLAVYYRYKPRDIAALSGNGSVHIHVTALDRIRWATDGYAPTNLPETFTVVDADVNDKPSVRKRVAEHQLLVETSRDERRDLRIATAALSRRRVRLYYGLLASTALLVLTLLPSLWSIESLRQPVGALSSALRPALGWANPGMTWVLRNLGSVVSGTIGIALPGSLEPLIQSLVGMPEMATLFVLVGGLMFWRQRVQLREMERLGEAMWRDAYNPERIQPSLLGPPIEAARDRFDAV